MRRKSTIGVMAADQPGFGGGGGLDAAAPRTTPPRVGRLWPAALLIVLTLALYRPTFSSEFLQLDDYQYVVDNVLVLHPSLDSVRRFLTEVQIPSTVAGYYQPLTMISLMFDAAVGGGEHAGPAVFHATNILLHALNAVLLWLLLRRVVPHAAAGLLAAVFFAVHPAQVESVAWISQRKTLLSTALALGCLICYVRHSRGGGSRWLAASWLGYVLGCMAKPTILLLPLVLPVFDYWPLRRPPREWLRGKWPFVLTMLLAAWVSVISQADSEARMSALNFQAAGLLPRLLGLVCYNLMLYIGNVVWPMHLSTFRTVPLDLSWSNPHIVASLAGAAVLLIIFCISFRRARPLFMALATLVILLAQVLGAIRFTHTFVADRFLYLPMVFLAVSLAGGLHALDSHFARGVRRPAVLRYSVVLLLVPLAILAHAQQAVWHDSVAFWTHVAEAAPDLEQAHRNLAVHHVAAGRLELAERHALRSVELEPELAGGHHVLGRIYTRTGRCAEAEREIRLALQYDPGPATDNARLALAQALWCAGRIDAATRELENAVRSGMDRTTACLEMGDYLLDTLRRCVDAEPFFRQAAAARADDPAALSQWARSLAECGRYDEALDAYERALARVRALEMTGPEIRQIEEIVVFLREKLNQPRSDNSAAQAP